VDIYYLLHPLDFCVVRADNSPTVRRSFDVRSFDETLSIVLTNFFLFNEKITRPLHSSGTDRDIVTTRTAATIKLKALTTGNNSVCQSFYHRRIESSTEFDLKSWQVVETRMLSLVPKSLAISRSTRRIRVIRRRREQVMAHPVMLLDLKVQSSFCR
jgi:hypothetical protein